MYKYIARRLALSLPVLVLSSLIVFGLMRVMPGDALTALMGESGNVSPKELQKLRKDLGLDLPYYKQYLIGVLSATRQDTSSDYAGRVAAITGLSMPDFWLGTLVITFAAIWFRWIPPLGYASLWDNPWTNLQQFLLPAAVLGFRLSAATMRMTRSTLLEVLREDYVRTAWAKGLGERII